METETGTRFMVVEQKGKDVWRGRYKSIEEALANDAAAIGVDRVLLRRSLEHRVTTIMVIIEEQRRIFLASTEDLLDEEKSKSRTDWRGRPVRILPYLQWRNVFLGPHLHTKQKRANAC